MRALAAPDRDAARACVLAQVGGTPYAPRALEQLDSALAGLDPECTGLVVTAATNDPVRGVALFGPLAAAGGVTRLHLLSGSGDGVLVLLAGAVVAACGALAGRMIVCELADDAPFAAATAALVAAGFRREGQVPDFFRDGVALVILVWRRKDGP